MNFNDRLADLRRKRGLSQEQLGYELGVSRQTVSKWELGQSYPDFQRLVLLSDYYEMSLDELVRGVDVGDVRALNESDKQISSIYSDVERGKEAALRAWRAFLVVGCFVLALFALVVAYGVLSGGALREVGAGGGGARGTTPGQSGVRAAAATRTPHLQIARLLPVRHALDAHGGVGGGNAGVARGVVPDAVDLGDVARVLLAPARDLGGANGLERGAADYGAVRQRTLL